MNVLDIVFISILLFSLFSNFLSLPGNFIVALNTLWYGIVTGFHKYSFSWFITLLLIAVLVELVEYLLITMGARKYGASRWGVVGSIVGGILGSISGAFFSPVVGAIVGGFAGVLLGTLIVEMVFKKRGFNEAKRAIMGALIGRVGALSVKAVGTVTMVMIVSYKLFL